MLRVILEDAGVTSRVAGLYWSDNSLNFKIEHQISKAEARAVVRELGIAPIERPFIADNMDDLLARFQTGNFDGSDLEDVIHFLATMPGGGAQFLIGGSDGSDVGSSTLKREQLEQVYKAVRSALYMRSYKEHANPDNMEMVETETGMQAIDMDAHEFARKEARKLQKMVRMNQQKYFGGDWRATKHGPEKRSHREMVSSKLVEYYLDKTKDASFNAMKTLVPSELHQMFLGSAQYSQDISNEQFKILTKKDRIAAQQQQQKRTAAASAKKRFENLIGERWNLYKFADNTVNGDEDKDFEVLSSWYTMYTEVSIPAQALCFRLSEGLTNAFASGLVTKFERHDWGLEAFSWDTQLDGLSVFVAEADKASHMVKKDGGVLSSRDLAALQKADANYGKNRGVMMNFLSWVVQTAIFNLKKDEKLAKQAVVQTVMGSNIVFTV